MITAIIRNKENTLVLELPHSIYDIYEKLQSIGIICPPFTANLITAGSSVSSPARTPSASSPMRNLPRNRPKPRASI